MAAQLGKSFGYGWGGECWGGEIAAGATLTIWTMDGSCGFSCEFGSNIWNNREDDDAVLIDAGGASVDRFDS